MREIESNWIAEYLRYTRGTETPEVFHLWIAFSLLAACLERSSYLYQGHFNLYPNLYIIIVAGTASCHKSAAISMGKRVLSCMDNPPRIFAQKITNERLIQFMAEGVEGKVKDNSIKFKSTGYIMSGELKSFLGKGAIDSGIITTLTDLYDPQDAWRYETKGSGTDVLQNTCLNLLGASTRKWLREAIPGEALGGGFMSRTLFVYSENPRGPFPHPQDNIPDDYDELKLKLANDLDHIRNNLSGEFEYQNKRAKDWYAEWYTNEIKRQRRMDSNQDFFSRWPQFMLKLAMISSVAEDDSLQIKVSHLKNAAMYLSSIRGEMSPVIDTMIVADSEVSTAKVLGIIKRRDSITHQRLAKYTSKFIKAEGLKQVIETLDEAGEIRVDIMPGGPERRTYTYIGGGGEE